MIDLLLYVGYILLVLCALAAIIMPLMSAMSNPSALVKSGIGLGALVVVFLISWGISGSEVLPVYTAFGIDAGLSKFVGGVLTTMYILGIGAIVGIVYTEVSKVFK